MKMKKEKKILTKATKFLVCTI